MLENLMAVPKASEKSETRDIDALMRDDALLDGAIEQGVRRRSCRVR